jgi:DNA-binding beta-propeller fold protein YncE
VVRALSNVRAVHRRRWVIAVALAVSAMSCPWASVAVAGGERPFVESLTGLGPVGFHPGSFAGDGGPARLALVDSPTTVAVDREGGVLFTDSFNNRIRRIDESGRIDTVVGPGRPGSCNAVAALRVCLSIPHGIAVERDGALLIADTFNHRVLRVRHGRASVLAGTGEDCPPPTPCSVGATAARTRLRWPVIARPTAAGVVVVDGGAHRILLFEGGRVRVLAGTGRRGYEGGLRQANHTPLNAPTDAIRYRGGWLVSDSGNCRVRFIDRRGRIRLFAGGRISLARCWRSYNDQGRWRDWGRPLRNVGDGAPARQARILVPGFMASDGSNVWVTDFLNHRLREIDGQSERITTVLGTGRPALRPTMRGPATDFALYWPSGVALEKRGTLLVTDSGAHRVMRLVLGRDPT